MDYRDIREKSRRYWLGETTLEEEKQLKTFFEQHPAPLPEDLQEIAALFLYYRQEGQQPLPELQIPGSTGKKKSLRMQTGTWMRYWEYAAVWLVLLGSLWMLKPGKPHPATTAALTDTFQDPQQALQVTRKALQMVAANLNKGKTQMQKLGVLNEVAQKVHGTEKQ